MFKLIAIFVGVISGLYFSTDNQDLKQVMKLFVRWGPMVLIAMYLFARFDINIRLKWRGCVVLFVSLLLVVNMLQVHPIEQSAKSEPNLVCQVQKVLIGVTKWLPDGLSGLHQLTDSSKPPCVPQSNHYPHK